MHLTFHLIHIGGRVPRVADVTFEVRHLCDDIYLFKNGFFRPAGNELTLMGGDGAKLQPPKQPGAC